ncbi:MAG: hypothetical protein AVDCRST_MAG12-285, partial [uncultured Rubrobacteraceae bacterium]
DGRPGRCRAAETPPAGTRTVLHPAPDRGGEPRAGGPADRPVARGPGRGDGPERVRRLGPPRGEHPPAEPLAPRAVPAREEAAGAGEVAQAPRHQRGHLVRRPLRRERVGAFRPLAAARAAVRRDGHPPRPRRDARLRPDARHVHGPGAAGARPELEAAAPAGVVRRAALARARAGDGRAGAAGHHLLRRDHGLRRLRVPRPAGARRGRGVDPPGPRRRRDAGVRSDLRGPL